MGSLFRQTRVCSPTKLRNSHTTRGWSARERAESELESWRVSEVKISARRTLTCALGTAEATLKWGMRISASKQLRQMSVRMASHVRGISFGCTICSWKLIHMATGSAPVGTIVVGAICCYITRCINLMMLGTNRLLVGFGDGFVENEPNCWNVSCSDGSWFAVFLVVLHVLLNVANIERERETTSRCKRFLSLSNNWATMF